MAWRAWLFADATRQDDIEDHLVGATGRFTKNESLRYNLVAIVVRQLQLQLQKALAGVRPSRPSPSSMSLTGHGHSIKFAAHGVA